MSSELLVIDDGPTRKLILNRPAKRNAINNAMLTAMTAELTRAATDDAVRTIVLTGAGDYFCGGRDRKNFDGPTAGKITMQDGSLDANISNFARLLTQLIEYPKPTIAAVRGFARAGGQALMLACDFVVAERTCTFGNPEMQFGFPAALNTVLLARHLGRRRALEIAISGAIYSAEAYDKLGLINCMAEPGTLDAATANFAAPYNRLAPYAVRRTKELFRIAEDSDMLRLLYAGDQLNHLLTLNGQLEPLFNDTVKPRA